MHDLQILLLMRIPLTMRFAFLIGKGYEAPGTHQQISEIYGEHSLSHKTINLAAYCEILNILCQQFKQISC